MDKQSKSVDYMATIQAASFDTACSVLKMKDSQGENTVYIIFINISSFLYLSYFGVIMHSRVKR